jgi:predicted RNA binding protein YcfA (HicA-like mRNA interferase family)
MQRKFRFLLAAGDSVGANGTALRSSVDAGCFEADGGGRGRKSRMTKKRKLLEKILAGSKNIQFDELVALAEAFGFRLSRINGSHHIFNHSTVPAILNLQNRKGKAVPYQVRQFLAIIEEYALTLEDEA